MERQELVIQRGPTTLGWTLRDFVAMGFRRRRAVLVCFFGLLLGTIVFAMFFSTYRAETEILLHRERVDPVATAEQSTPLVVSSLISEEEVNSEVELIKSRDVLRPVVVKTGLDQNIHPLFRHKTPLEKIDIAVESLRNSLIVEALPKTNMVQIQYASAKPEVAALVLEELDNSYVEKHREMHYPAGQFKFFDQETEKASTDLQTAEAKLKEFPGQVGTANPTVTRDFTLQKLTESNYDLGQTREAIAETSHRIDSLRQLQKTTPPRLTTQMRDADAEGVLQQMKSTLLALDLKRSDMASKYKPDYPPLLELNKEIADTQTAIEAEKPVKDVTTDQNPAYVWIDGELAKAQADLRGYQAKADAIEKTVSQTTETARKLDVNSIEQADLVRTAEAAEDSFCSTSANVEEAGIGEDGKQKFFGRDRLFEKVECAESGGAHCHLNVRLARHHDDGSRDALRLQFFEKCESIFAGHDYVRQNQVEGLRFRQFQSLVRVVTHGGLVAFKTEGPREGSQRVGFVIDNE